VEFGKLIKVGKLTHSSAQIYPACRDNWDSNLRGYVLDKR